MTTEEVFVPQMNVKCKSRRNQANYHNQNAKILNDSKFVALENESTRLEREQPGIIETRFQQWEFLKS